MSNVILDDRDPSIVYSSGWHAGGAANEYNGTTTYTNAAGAKATLTFHGISIGVYGTLGAGSTTQKTQYQLDGSLPTIYQPPFTSIDQWNLCFYQSPTLPDGQHTLVVTNLVEGANIFILDYFILAKASALNIPPSPYSQNTPSASSSSPSSLSSPTAATNTHAIITMGPGVITSTAEGKGAGSSSSSSSTATGSPSPSTLTSLAGGALNAPKGATPASGTSRNSGIVVGTVVGLLFLLMLLVALVYLWRRRRNRVDEELVNVQSAWVDPSYAPTERQLPALAPSFRVDRFVSRLSPGTTPSKALIQSPSAPSTYTASSSSPCSTPLPSSKAIPSVSYHSTSVKLPSSPVTARMPSGSFPYSPASSNDLDPSLPWLEPPKYRP